MTTQPGGEGLSEAQEHRSGEMSCDDGPQSSASTVAAAQIVTEAVAVAA
jgi:hypothetical protein